MWLLYILQMKYNYELRDVFFDVWFAVVGYKIVDLEQVKLRHTTHQCYKTYMKFLNTMALLMPTSIPYLCVCSACITHTHALYYI